MASAIECHDCKEHEGEVDLQCKIHKICKECASIRFADDAGKNCSICSPSTPPKSEEMEKHQPIWIYVDDSNIWIEAKKLMGKKKEFKTKEDHRVRIEIGRLTECVAAGRPVAQGFLYGSEPPPVDTVWDKIRGKGWKVDPHRRSRMTGKEKKVDTQLVADITERVCKTPVEERSTIILITGDADAMPAINKSLENGWKVEVYMWENAISNDLKSAAKKKELDVFYLDDYLQKVTFTNMKFSLEGNEHLLSKVKQSGVVLTLRSDTFKNGAPTTRWCQKIESIAQWPFQYYWIQSNCQKNKYLLLYFKQEKENIFDVVEFFNAIDECELEYVIDKKTYLEYYQHQQGIINFETIGRYGFTDVIKGPDTDETFADDTTEGKFKLVRYQHHCSKQRYTDPCPYKFNCKYGNSCYDKHTDEEKKFFRSNMGKGKPYHKVKLCHHFPKCKKSSEECVYAHGEDDAWCLLCNNKGHFTDNCKQKKMK